MIECSHEAIVNPEDFEENFWRNNYLVCMSELGPTLLVNAESEQDALDYAVDYCEDRGWEGLFLDHDDITELIYDAKRDGYDGDEVYIYVDEHPMGGNHCRYLSSHNVTIKEVKHGKV